jgi:GNAT superfamily N-acetyltransferase
VAEVDISAYSETDFGELFALFAAIVEEGATYPQVPPLTEEEFRGVWLSGTSSVQVARLDGRAAGGYYLKPNFTGRASHIGNAGYAVAADLRGRGIGRALGEHSLDEARRCGFDALMFNLVFERNPARRLWESLGFEQIGRIPDAIAGGGGVDQQDAIVYWRSLGDS